MQKQATGGSSADAESPVNLLQITLTLKWFQNSHLKVKKLHIFALQNLSSIKDSAERSKFQHKTASSTEFIKHTLTIDFS